LEIQRTKNKTNKRMEERKRKPGGPAGPCQDGKRGGSRKWKRGGKKSPKILFWGGVTRRKGPKKGRIVAHTGEEM